MSQYSSHNATSTNTRPYSNRTENTAASPRQDSAVQCHEQTPGGGSRWVESVASRFILEPGKPPLDGSANCSNSVQYCHIRQYHRVRWQLLRQIRNAAHTSSSRTVIHLFCALQSALTRSTSLIRSLLVARIRVCVHRIPPNALRYHWPSYCAQLLRLLLCSLWYSISLMTGQFCRF